MKWSFFTWNKTSKSWKRWVPSYKHNHPARHSAAEQTACTMIFVHSAYMQVCTGALCRAGWLCLFKKILKNIFANSRHKDTIMLRQRTIYYEMTSAKTHDWTTFRTMQQRLYRRRVCINNMILVRFYQFRIQNLTTVLEEKTSRKIRRILFYYIF